METEDGNCYLSQRHALFCEESLGKIDAEMSSFPGTGRSTNSIAWNRWLLLNKWMLQWQLRWWGYKLVGRCKLSCYENESCDGHGVNFWRWLKWLAMFITFLLSSNDLYLHTRMFCRKYSLNILKNTRPSSMTWWYRVLWMATIVHEREIGFGEAEDLNIFCRYKMLEQCRGLYARNRY